MNKNLVYLEGKVIYTDSLIVSKELKRDHVSITRAIERHKDKLERYGVIELGVQKPTKKNGGRPFKIYKLKEEQLSLLLMFMDNSEEVVEFKVRINDEFYRMRKYIIKLQAQKTNEEWLKTREETKLIRKESTDTIKKFIEYAKSQGSTNYKRYYENITRMENKSLFLITQKFDNLRDVLDKRSLDKIKMADEIVTYALEEGMEQGMNYKDIYQLAKKRIEQFAELTPIPAIPDHWFKRIDE